MGRILTLNRGMKEPEMPRYNFTTTGTIVYDPPRPGMKRRTEWWAIASVDRDITAYYRWWVKKLTGIELNQPAWNAHCSIVRSEKPRPEYQAAWKQFQERSIQIQYGHEIKIAPAGKEDFWYIDAYAPEFLEIRKSLGLKTFHNFHLTIGKAPYPVFPRAGLFIQQ